MNKNSHKRQVGITVSDVVKVEQVDDDSYVIVCEGEEISPMDTDVIHRLFPNVIEQAYDLLNTELLLSKIKTGKER